MLTDRWTGLLPKAVVTLDQGWVRMKCEEAKVAPDEDAEPARPPTLPGMGMDCVDCGCPPKAPTSLLSLAGGEAGVMLYSGKAIVEEPSKVPSPGIKR